MISSIASYQLLPDLNVDLNVADASEGILYGDTFQLGYCASKLLSLFILVLISLVDILRFLYSTTSYWEFLVL